MADRRLLCPIAECGRYRQRWQIVCPKCWGRVPVALQDAVKLARRQRAAHRIARAEIAATAWLRANPFSVAIAADAARRCGERFEAPG